MAGSHRAIAYSRRYARPSEDIPLGQDDRMLPHVDDVVSLVRAIDAAPRISSATLGAPSSAY